MSDEKEKGTLKDKLIATKQKWAKAGRLLTGKPDDTHANRLPPGQKLVTNWPVLDLGLQPDVSKDEWRLTVDGLVENPVTLSFATFQQLPQTESVSDIHCVTQWSRYDNHWQGVAARDLIAHVRPKVEAAHVVFHSHDGYTTNVAFDVFAADDVMIAHAWEGQPLAREHGGPVRIVIPRFYFWKSAKWVKRIEFRRDDQPGFWEVRGYHNVGDPWTEERYS
ncbi:MAG: sulfite oxidase-like oxidoreductase [Alphaproteobacteria bacterium]|nr:sulfite oxidase-like oxidoreductase [Alphaproteobacteria bacterium]